MKIPKTFHQVWTSLGGEGDPGRMPSDYRYYQNTWRKKHPNWVHIEWGDKDLFPLINQEAYDNSTTFAARSDILRLEIIYKYGGVYVDTDFECYKNVEPLIHNTDCFIGCESEGVMTNALFGAVKEHPTIKKLIDAVPESLNTYTHYPPNITTGPAFWTRTLEYDEITMFPPKYFYPVGPGIQSHRDQGRAYPDAYANHHWGGSWTNSETQALWANFQPEWEALLKKKANSPNTKVHPHGIEKIFHTIWIGGDLFPEEFRHYRQTWLKHHPDWTMIFWDDENLPVNSFFNEKLYNKTKGLSSKADIAQYELLYKYGGVYIDADFECYKNIEPLIQDCNAWGCGEMDSIISTGILGFKKGHPMLRKIMKNFAPHMKKYKHEPADVTTGPIFLTETIGVDAIKMLPREYFYPYSYYEQHKKGNIFPDAYAAHHWAASWIK
ncbi:MAG: glycosyltransferase [Methanobacteriaceae archaeon]|nr:glycosyltransferase [Methanobacteriaceae archaeon]